MIGIEIIAAQQEHLMDVQALFMAYATWRNFDQALDQFDEELQNLPGDYSPPEGGLLVAYVNEIPAGCVAYKRLTSQVCEMKRFYVSEMYRKQGIGSQLIDALIAMAQTAGYRQMKLDTHPSMENAINLYQRMGFAETERYNQNPIPGIRFFQRSL